MIIVYDTKAVIKNVLFYQADLALACYLQTFLFIINLVILVLRVLYITNISP